MRDLNNRNALICLVYGDVVCPFFCPIILFYWDKSRLFPTAFGGHIPPKQLFYFVGDGHVRPLQQLIFENYQTEFKYLQCIFTSQYLSLLSETDIIVVDGHARPLQPAKY
jgi:hypothetical protein